MAVKGTIYVRKDLGIGFIPIPKNGSSTIRSFFFNWDPMKSGGYFNFIESPEILYGLRIIAVISDPTIRFARGITEILNREESINIIQTKEFAECNTSECKVKCLLDQIEDIGFYGPHIKPQFDFISDSSGKVIDNLDFWLLKDLTKKIKEIDPKYSGKKEWSRGEAKNSYLDSINRSPEIMGQIRKLYSKDFELFETVNVNNTTP